MKNHKAAKWYKAFFQWLLNACLVNAWVDYKRACNSNDQKPIDLLAFSLAVAEDLCSTYSPGLVDFNASLLQEGIEEVSVEYLGPRRSCTKEQLDHSILNISNASTFTTD
ncbi:hypothetical protein Ciccas_006867, partial [Cichlidogyrus casuarinus]